MAHVNADRPRGMVPIRHLNGSPWNGAMEIYFHTADDAVAIYKNSLVSSAVGLTTPGDDPLGIYQSIIMSTDSDEDILGVAVAFGNTPQICARVNDLNAANYCPLSVAMYVGVIIDPTVVYLIQDDGTTLTAAQIGMNTTTVGNANGSTTTGRSSCELEQGSMASTVNGLPLKTLRLHPRVDNELSAWADWEVVINANVYKDPELVYLTT
jgi:hypothetical protein